MNVLLVNGSPREKNTYVVLKSFEEKLNKEQFNTKLISIKDYQIQECIGCYKCVTDGNQFCPFNNDDTKSVWAEFVNADAIVLSAPVFALGVPSIFKKFMDRIAYNAHRPQFYNKPTILVSTTAGMGTDNVFKQLAWFKIAGLRIISKNGFMVYPIGNDNKNIIKKKNLKIDKSVQKLSSELRSSKKIKPKMIQVIQFYGLKLNCNFGKDLYKADFEYFSNRDFFTDSKINPLKKAFGEMVYKLGINALKNTIDKT